MKFYNVPVMIQFEKENREIRLENVIVSYGMGKCTEIMSETPIRLLGNSQRDQKIIAEDRSEFGFCLYTDEKLFLPKRFAKKEDVKNYMRSFSNSQFQEFLNNYSYVFGTDHKEIKQLIKQQKHAK